MGKKVYCRWSFDPIFVCPYHTGPDDTCYTVCGYRRMKMKQSYEEKMRLEAMAESEGLRLWDELEKSMKNKEAVK